jgi:protease-4
MNQRSLGCLLALVCAALLVSLFVNLAQFAGGVASGMGGTGGAAKPRAKFSEVELVAGKGEGKLVQIDLEGMITGMTESGFFGVPMSGVERVKTQLEQAAGDDRVKAVVLRINSPGGEVTASDTLYTAVKKLAEQKPVVVHMDAVAASGGYYIACGATKVVAAETTLTGSIGVIIDTINYAELFDKVGLKSRAFVSGPFKDSLSGGREMREEKERYVQQLVDEMYDKFLGVVAEGRGLNKAALRSGVADGRVVTGGQALKAGLVDALGYVEDAYKLAGELAGVEGAQVVRYRREVSLFEMLGGAEAGARRADRTLRLELGGAAGAFALRPGVPYFVMREAVAGE